MGNTIFGSAACTTILIDEGNLLNFVFEKVDNTLPLNLTECPDLNSSGIKRLTVSPVISSLIRCWRVNYQDRKHIVGELAYSLSIPDEGEYIISVGVAHSPGDWCGADPVNGPTDNFKPYLKNLFDFISEPYLKDLRNGRAFLLLDQTHEGYQTSWLWDWFYNSCVHYKINPRQIIYITGNMDCGTQYDAWAESKGHTQDKMLVIPHAHFENVIYEISEGYKHPTMLPPGITDKRELPTLERHLDYKRANIENIKMFNVLQKRPRGHRMWFFKYLVDAGLLDNNIVSMNEFNYESTYFENRMMDREDYDNISKLLPLTPNENPANYNKDNFESGDGGIYVLSLNDRTMLNSWCTVVSEASYGASEVACFLSEKTFKPIACSHPFIIVGSKGSLANLRKMGYKTFSPYIDESYDDLDDWERMDAITKEMQRLNAMSHEQRLEWFTGLADILRYNYNVLSSNYANHVPALMTLFSTHIGK